jgi:hypothetical protein
MIAAIKRKKEREGRCSQPSIHIAVEQKRDRGELFLNFATRESKNAPII